MNSVLLLRIADSIERANKAVAQFGHADRQVFNFDMRQYGILNSEHGASHHECGTSGCIAGHAMAITDPYLYRQWTIAREGVGIDDYYLLELFARRYTNANCDSDGNLVSYYRPFDIAKYLLDLSDRDARMLFTGEYDNYSAVIDLHKINYFRWDVPNILRWMVENNTVNWLRAFGAVHGGHDLVHLEDTHEDYNEWVKRQKHFVPPVKNPSPVWKVYTDA